MKGQPRSLKKVTCIFWEVDSVEEFATLEASRSPLNHLMRCDRFTKNGNDSVLPAPTRFSCISKVRGRYMKFFVSQRKLYKASFDRLNTVTFVLIFRFRHRFFQKTLLGPHPCSSYTNISIALRRLRMRKNLQLQYHFQCFERLSMPMRSNRVLLISVVILRSALGVRTPTMTVMWRISLKISYT